MNKNNYDIDYFLQNEAFVMWVKRPDSESNLFWKEWLHSHPTNKDAFLQAKELILAMNFEKSEPSESDFNEVLQKVLQGNESRVISMSEKVRSNQWKWTARVAASLTLLMIASYVFFYNEMDSKNEAIVENAIAKINPYGRKSKLAFSDGSTATLNAGSSLRYLSKFDSDLREVELEGEAFFEVNRDVQRPFVVRLGELSATVLGTSFNIEAHRNETVSRIQLKTGKLKVEVSGTANTTETYILVPGQKLVYDKRKKQAELSTMATEDMGLWTEGVLVFEYDDFETITKKLERWFDVEISPEGLVNDNISFSTRYRNESLNNILISMGFALNFDHEINEKSVKINFKKQ
ncbi:MAG: FecR domain-containing protein [Reichenbachiella sp.]|uniref:FecR family protein n=1 Tax=Reichenbachiella sp. TaxID=2184521 RepID=UPI0032633032